MKKIIILIALSSLVAVVGCSKPDSSTNDTNDNPKTVISQDAQINNTDNLPDSNTDMNSEDENSVPNDNDPSLDNDKLSNFDKRVLCWGTSLTHGTGGEGVSMPGVLGRLSGANVVNYGGYAENTNCIATRSGASKLTITSDITIPVDASPVEINFETEFGDIELLLKYTDTGLNPVTIDGILGKLSREEPEEGNVHYYFTRFESGDEKQIPAQTIIYPYSVSDKNSEDINIIWTAGNDTFNTSDDIQILLDKIDKMIEFSESDKYIIMSECNLHSSLPYTDGINEALEEHYGEHFINFRKYLIEEAFSDLGLFPSSEDSEDIEAYEIPRYFRIDEVHGNSLYYYLAGTQVYKKCQELGYLK